LPLVLVVVVVVVVVDSVVVVVRSVAVVVSSRRCQMIEFLICSCNITTRDVQGGPKK